MRRIWAVYTTLCYVLVALLIIGVFWLLLRNPFRDWQVSAQIAMRAIRPRR